MYNISYRLFIVTKTCIVVNFISFAHKILHISSAPVGTIFTCHKRSKPRAPLINKYVIVMHVPLDGELYQRMCTFYLVCLSLYLFLIEYRNFCF